VETIAKISRADFIGRSCAGAGVVRQVHQPRRDPVRCPGSSAHGQHGPDGARRDDLPPEAPSFI